MAKKLEENGMWDSSRMILPEHREAILRDNKNIKKRIMPILLADEWEVYFRIISESYYTKKQIKVFVFDEFEDIEYIGVVERIDTQNERIKLDNVWIEFRKIVGVVDTK